MRGRAKSSRRRWLCSSRRRSLSSLMDCFGRDDMMPRVLWGSDRAVRGISRQHSRLYLYTHSQRRHSGPSAGEFEVASRQRAQIADACKYVDQAHGTHLGIELEERSNTGMALLLRELCNSSATCTSGHAGRKKGKERKKGRGGGGGPGESKSFRAARLIPKLAWAPSASHHHTSDLLFSVHDTPLDASLLRSRRTRTVSSCTGIQLDCHFHVALCLESRLRRHTALSDVGASRTTSRGFCQMSATKQTPLSGAHAKGSTATAGGL